MRDREPGIDLLRIIAAAAVVAFHYIYLYPNAGHIPAATQSLLMQTIAAHGYFGVELFFMISGYVITMTAEARTRSRFAYARLVRLWPAFIICMTITAAALTLRSKAPSSIQFLANSTMLPTILGQPYIDGVYWSLMFEIIFYAAVGLFVIGPNFPSRLRWFATAWLLLAAVKGGIPVSKIRTLLVLEYAPFFCVGIGIFLLRRFNHQKRDIVLAVTALLMSVHWAYTGSAGIGLGLAFQPIPWVCGLMAIGSAALVYVAPSWRLNNTAAIAITLGGISYPLYLLHGQFGSMLYLWVLDLGVVHALAMTMTTAAVLVLSAAVWRVELSIRTRISRAQRFSRTPLGSPPTG